MALLAEPLSALASLLELLDQDGESITSTTYQYVWGNFQALLQPTYDDLLADCSELREQNKRAMEEVAKVRGAANEVVAKYQSVVDELRAEVEALKAAKAEMEFMEQEALVIEAKITQGFRRREAAHEQAVSASEADRLQLAWKLERAYVDLGTLKSRLQDKYGEYVINAQVEQSRLESRLASAVQEMDASKVVHAEELGRLQSQISAQEAQLRTLHQSHTKLGEMHRELVSKNAEAERQLSTKKLELQVANFSWITMQEEHKLEMGKLENKVKDAEADKKQGEQEYRDTKAKLSSAELSIDKYSEDLRVQEKRAEALEQENRWLKRGNQSTNKRTI